MFSDSSRITPVIPLAVILALIGIFEIIQPGDNAFSSLTGGIITFNMMTRLGILTLVVVGLNLLMGYTGQVSLGQAAFYACGAYVSAILTTKADVFKIPSNVADSWWYLWLLMIVGMGLTGLIAFLVARPILRLKGHYLAMATLGLGIVVVVILRENFGISRSVLNLTGGSDGIPDIPRLRVGAYELWPITRFYFLIWGVALAGLVLAQNLINSRVGRAARAIHGNEIAAEAMGIDTARYKTQIFVLSAIYASLAGSLYAHFQVSVSPRPFDFIASLELVVMASVGGMATIWGAPLGVFIILAIEELLRAKLHLVIEGASGEIETIVYGVILVSIMIFLPEGLLPVITRRWKRSYTSAGLPARSKDDLQWDEVIQKHASRSDTVLEVSHISKHFGGLQALYDVSCTVRRGQIKGIIGPNGAGKSTLFNIITGLYPPDSGDIRLEGKNLLAANTYEISSLGVSRTFQNIRLFHHMTVLENVMVGRHIRARSGFLGAMLRTTAFRQEEAAIKAHAMRLLELLGIADRAHEDASSLPFGLQRKVELARALATDPQIIMLDEPASGLNYGEREEVISLIRQLASQNMTIILIEHDMSMVMGLVDSVLVLNTGMKIADDVPEQVQQDPEVIAAYLGS